MVGANGAGKTTLLRILAGDLEPLDGSVSTAPADAFVGWLPQEHERVPGETVGHYVARRTGAAAATAAMEQAAAALGAGDHTRAAAGCLRAPASTTGRPAAHPTSTTGSRRCWPTSVSTSTRVRR